MMNNFPIAKRYTQKEVPCNSKWYHKLFHIDPGTKLQMVEVKPGTKEWDNADYEETFIGSTTYFSYISEDKNYE